MDIHWAPYYVDCSPCLVKYDWIIKLEDINRNELEEELLLRSIHKKGFSAMIKKIFLDLEWANMEHLK